MTNTEAELPFPIVEKEKNYISAHVIQRMKVIEWPEIKANQ